MKKFLIAAVAAVLTCVAIPPAHAIFGVGDIVLDPSNLAQNILSAERALVQIENQVQSLTNEAQMLLNEAANLEHLDFNTLERLRNTIATVQSLFDRAEGLSFNIDQMQSQFERLYPAHYTGDISIEQMTTDAHERWENSRHAFDTSLQLQAQTKETFGSDEAVLSDLVTQSQSAVGALQAAQASNQLLALLARQQIQAQQIAISQDRAVATEQARALAEVERAREMRRRFMTRETRYTAEPVSGF